MKKNVLIALAIACALSAPVAFGADSGFYVLGGIGQPSSNNDQSNLDNALRSVGGVGFGSSLSKPTVYKLQLGYQITTNFAVEGGYIGSSNETYTASGGNLAGPISASGNVKGWNLTAVGILPLVDQFSLLGKLGVASLKESVTVVGPGGAAAASGSKTDLTYGIGAKYDFTKEIFARFDVDSYNIGNSNSSSRSTVWMLGVGYKF